jgi:hypothetical protein
MQEKRGMKSHDIYHTAIKKGIRQNRQTG